MNTRGGKENKARSGENAAENKSTTLLNGDNKKSVHDVNGIQQSTLLSVLQNALFVTVPALIVFVAFGNTLTWHLQRFWGASGDFWQNAWDRFLDIVGDDEETLWVYGSVVLTTVVFWIIGGIYTVIDITNPAVLSRYKIQPGTNEPVDTTRLMKLIGMVIINQTVVALPISYLGYQHMSSKGLPPVRELPSFHRLITEVAIALFVHEISFYYSHRLLHSRHLYRFIHKKHHEWTAPIAIAAEYCNPIEHVFANIIPVTLGVSIMRSHIATAWIWFILELLITLNDHSGYHFPFFFSPEAHDFHHLKFNQCFGTTLGIMDYIHGTDKLFRSSRAYDRNVTMLSTVPLREAFPDGIKRNTK